VGSWQESTEKRLYFVDQPALQIIGDQVAALVALELA
jgi:hypothetical protein